MAFRWKDMKVRPYLSLFCHSLDLTPFVDAHHNRCRHRGHHHHYRGLRSEGDEVGAALTAYGRPPPRAGVDLDWILYALTVVPSCTYNVSRPPSHPSPRLPLVTLPLA